MNRVIGVAVGIEKRRSRVSIDTVKEPVFASVHSGMLASIRYITEKRLHDVREGGAMS